MGLVVLVAFGLLGMHGLTSAGSSHESVGHAPDAVAPAAGHATHAAPGHTTGGAIPGALDHAMGGGAHNPLHAIGQACLWLLAGGALLVFARQLGRVATERLADIRPRRSRARPAWTSLHHPPDPRLATVTLRC